MKFPTLSLKSWFLLGLLAGAQVLGTAGETSTFCPGHESHLLVGHKGRGFGFPLGIVALGADDLLVSLLQEPGKAGFDQPAILIHQHRVVPGNRAYNWRLRRVRVESNAFVHPGTLIRETEHTVLSVGLNGIQRLILGNGNLGSTPLRIHRVETLLTSENLTQLGCLPGPVQMEVAVAPDGSIIVGLPDKVIQLPKGSTACDRAEVRWLLGAPPGDRSGAAGSKAVPDAPDRDRPQRGMAVAVASGDRLFAADPKRRFVYQVDLVSGKKSLWLEPSRWLEEHYKPSQMLVHGNSIFILGDTGNPDDPDNTVSRLLRLSLDEGEARATTREVESVEIMMLGVSQACFTPSGDLVMADLYEACLRYIANAVAPPGQDAARMAAKQLSDEVYHKLLAELEETKAPSPAQVLHREDPAGEATTGKHEQAPPAAPCSGPAPRGSKLETEAFLDVLGTEGIWETFTRRRRPEAGSSASSSAEDQAEGLDRAHLAAYLHHRFRGKGLGGFEWMWRRHAPLDLVNGKWLYTARLHKHSYEENPEANQAINNLLATDLGSISVASQTGALVRQRFTLPKATIRDLSAWILDRCAQAAPPCWARIDFASDGRVKILVHDLADLVHDLPAPLREEWVRTDGRTGLTVDLSGRLVWEYGLRIVLDHSGLKTVHAAGRQALRHLPLI